MNYRQLIGVLGIAVGGVLISIAVHSMHELTKTKERTTHVEIFFTHNPFWNPIIKFFGGKPQEKLPEHHRPAIIMESIGIVLVVVGGVVVYVSRGKNKRS
ncbi:MAG TPA: hypothetical protein VIJ14_08965 [Rhabdochlamydiaceae bacterium]